MPESPLPQDVADLRRDYRLSALDEVDVADDPIEQFRRWFDDALRAQVPEPNAMTVASVDPDGQPSARVLLLKGIDGGGFTFFTNYESRKAGHWERNPRAALVFLWHELERQVRVEGTVTRVSAAESDEYYLRRPLGSRLGAWASPQSRVIADRAVLERREAEYRERFGDAPPRPAHWGGYRCTPHLVEFWQGRPSRMHDRLRYRLADGRWQLERLAP